MIGVERGLASGFGGASRTLWDWQEGLSGGSEAACGGTGSIGNEQEDVDVV